MCETRTKRPSFHRQYPTRTRDTVPDVVSIPDAVGSRACGTLTGPSFWKRTTTIIKHQRYWLTRTAHSADDWCRMGHCCRTGRLPFDVSHLARHRLEPLTKALPWASKSRSAEPHQSSPSPHWRPVLQVDKGAPLPIHRLFAAAQIPNLSDEPFIPQPTGGESEPMPSKNPSALPQVSHMSLYSSIFAAWRCIQQLPKPCLARLPLHAGCASDRAATNQAIPTKLWSMSCMQHLGNLSLQWNVPVSSKETHPTDSRDHHNNQSS